MDEIDTVSHTSIRTFAIIESKRLILFNNNIYPAMFISKNIS